MSAVANRRALGTYPARSSSMFPIPRIVSRRRRNGICHCFTSSAAVPPRNWNSPSQESMRLEKCRLKSKRYVRSVMPVGVRPPARRVKWRRAGRGGGWRRVAEARAAGRWRNYLKGLYDRPGHGPRILVTGSARLDAYRRGGDSLQGRYHLHRLHPLSLAELGDPAALRLLARRRRPQGSTDRRKSTAAALLAKAPRISSPLE